MFWFTVLAIRAHGAVVCCPSFSAQMPVIDACLVFEIIEDQVEDSFCSDGSSSPVSANAHVKSLIMRPNVNHILIHIYLYSVL